MSLEGLRVRDWVIPETDLDEEFTTAGGPGGQHANRTESSVTLRLDIPGSSLPEDVKAKLLKSLSPTVEVLAADTRSQWRNRAIARQRLGDKLDAALVETRSRKLTKPSKGAKQRRLEDKKARSKVKEGRKRPPPE